MKQSEKKAYIEAELCLMSSDPVGGFHGPKNGWDELIYIHLVQPNYIHNVGAFLPWHRLYVHLLEELLRNECGYKGYQPYWNEVFDVDDMAGSVVFDPKTGFGGNGSGDDGCVADGPSPEAFVSVNQSNIDDCFAFDTYSTAMDCYSGPIHAPGHSGVGKTMADAVASPSDPLFFLHQTNLDRLWWECAPLAPGTEFTSYSGDPGNETTLDHVLWMAGVIPNATIGDVMDLHGEFICAKYV
ncbi:hypothetical protein EDB80DRAFT_753793 [Ilyonectria destructans]|nr:hypothetical protein EDB80DRAFT_753793 [Ilyonectria destructans]